MRTLIAVLAVMLLATSAWAGLGLENELANPSFEDTTGWEVISSSGLVTAHGPYSAVAPFGVGAPTGGGGYFAGVAAQNVGFGGGIVRQVVDESLFSGWNPDYSQKIISVEFWSRMIGYADVPMTLNVYVDYMPDGSYPDYQAPGVIREQIAHIVGQQSGGAGWKFYSIDWELPTQPQYLSLEFEFGYFSGTGLNIVDLVDLQGQCVPEPCTMLVLGAGLVGMAIRRRR